MSIKIIQPYFTLVEKKYKKCLIFVNKWLYFNYTILTFIFIRMQITPKENSIHLDNQFVGIRIDNDWIWATDKTDLNNEPSLYTTKKRWVKRVSKLMVSLFADDTTYRDIQDCFDTYSIVYRSYCAVD